MTLLDSEEWLAYALNLVDNDRGVGLHDAFLEPRARQLENALVALFTGGDVQPLIACAQGRDPAESLAATRVLVRLVLAGDERIASTSREVVEAFRSVCERGYSERLTGRLALLAWLEAAPADATAFLSRHVIEDVLPLEAEVRVPIVGGGELILEPGEHVLRINLLDIPPPGYEDEHAWLLARVELVDSIGRILRAHAPLRTYSFIEMLRRGAPAASGNGPVVLSVIRCFSDGRRWLPVVDLQGEQPVARAYWEKYLCLSVTIRRARTRGIVLDVAHHDYSGVGGVAVPALAVSGDFIARAALGGLRFRLTNEVGTPQPGVRTIHHERLSGPAGQDVQRLSSILEEILSHCLEGGPCGALHEYAGWLAGVRLDAAEDRLLTVDPSHLRQYGELFYALEHLVRNFESTAALARLRELSATTTGAISDRAHTALARVGHADSDRIERALKEWRETRSESAARWLGQVAYGGLKITGATAEGVIEQVRALLGSPSRETASSLSYDASGESGIQLHVCITSMGRDLLQAHISSATTPRPPAAPGVRPEPVPRATFAVGADVVFVTNDGRHLRVGPEGLSGAFQLEGELPYEIRPDTSSIRLALYLSDEQGRTFKATRPLTTSLLLESWRAADVGHLCRPDQVPRWRAPSPSRASLNGVKILWAEARFVVAGRQHGEQDRWAPRLLDLCGRETVAALYPAADALTTVLQLSDEGEGLTGVFSSQEVATMVLMPSLLGVGARAYQPAVLVDTGRIEMPTPGVRLEG